MASKGNISDKVKQILNLVEQGKTNSEICVLLQCTQASICAAKKRNGIPPKYKYNWPEIQAFYDAGNSYPECRAKFGISSGAIWKAIQAGKFISRTSGASLKIHYKKNGVPRRANPAINDAIKLKIRQTIANKVKNGTWHYSFSRVRSHTFHSKFAGAVSLMGMWEYRYAEYLDANNINWKRPKEKFQYTFSGLKNGSGFYTPDFYLMDEGVYIEVKGYETAKDRAKWAAFPKNLKHRVLRKNDLERLGIQNLSDKNGGARYAPQAKPQKLKRIGEPTVRRVKRAATPKAARYCSYCLSQLNSSQLKYCSLECSGQCKRKTARPTKEALHALVSQKPMAQVARELKLKSETTLRKWCVSYGIDYKVLSPTSRVNRIAPPKKDFIPLSKYLYVSRRPKRNKWLAKKTATAKDSNAFYKTFDTEYEAAQFASRQCGSEQILMR